MHRNRVYSLSLKMKNKEDGLIWGLSSVYVPVRPYEREYLWLELSDINALWVVPCAWG